MKSGRWSRLILPGDRLAGRSISKIRGTSAAIVLCLALIGGASLAVAGDRAQSPQPDIVLLTVDTLRPDRMSGYGYERATSPALDRLMEAGVRFSEARTEVALSCPAVTSMLTAIGPHEHGSTRNGIRSRAGLPSFPKILARRGYATAAFVSNFMLTDRMCGLSEHFDHWVEVMARRRLLFGRHEADAEDVNRQALGWLHRYLRQDDGRPPFLVWLHYMEPHFPYRLRRAFMPQIGVPSLKGIFSINNRYDSEIAYVDFHIGEFLASLEDVLDRSRTIIVFAADHGESLGNHGYWGHGRHVYDASLRVPMSITWEGVIKSGVITEPALLTDLGSTILGLAGLPVPEFFTGFDWTPVTVEGDAPPTGRVTYHQAHRGTVKDAEERVHLRRAGLLEVGRVAAQRKEVLVLDEERRRVFDLQADGAEQTNLAASDSSPTPGLSAWLQEVRAALDRADDLPPPVLDDEALRELKALGYMD